MSSAGLQSLPQQCRCGSGLVRAQCCDLDLARLGAPDAHRHLIPLEEHAAQARARGDFALAERLALDIRKLSPGRVAALAVLYAIRTESGVVAAAEALIRRVVFIAKRLRALPRAAQRRDVAQPLFILDFPRSGTTLLE